MDTPPTIQVFATDIDAHAIAVAREGVYPDTIAADVSEERLRRFFSKDHRGFRVRREVRELVLFALHDLLKDAPFSRLDLISCRNLLIYLDRTAQGRAFEVFHFALRPEGRLYLGSSESADEARTLFGSVDKKHRIYVRRPGKMVPLPLPISSQVVKTALEDARQTSITATGRSISRSENCGSSSAAEELSALAGEAFTHEHQSRGRWFFTRGVPLRDESGEVTSVLVVSYDIHERKQVEQALRASEERLRLIFENAREYAIFTIGLDGSITSWNPGAERLLGFTEKEALGQRADLIFTPEDRVKDASEQQMATARTDGRANDERWHERRDGSRFFAIGAMMAMRDAQGEIVGFLKILRDQTETRQAQEALEQSRAELWEALQENRKAREALETASRAKDRFLAVLSHELRTPLTPVLMATHVLFQRSDLPEPLREVVEMIRRNVQIEAQFIDDLLDVTRIGHGKLEIIRELVDVHEVISRAVEITDSDIQAKNLRLSVSLKAERHQLMGDTTRLQQVVWNLLKNAAKFTGRDGQIRISSCNDKNNFVVTVADTGIGIEPAMLENIFDIFAQGGPEITRNYGGLGLGLAIAKAIVEAHNGSLHIASAGLGKGTTLTIELPLGLQEDQSDGKPSEKPIS